MSDRELLTRFSENLEFPAEAEALKRVLNHWVELGPKQDYFEPYCPCCGLAPAEVKAQSEAMD